MTRRLPLYCKSGRQVTAGIGPNVGLVRVVASVTSGTRDAEGRRVVMPMTIEEAEELRRELAKGIAVARGKLEDEARERRRRQAGAR